MSIQHAILGLLSSGPLTGYDLKKIIQDSTFMHWSGNNNQIYRSLVDLLQQGYVTNELHHQESSPSKKVYTITPEGLEELHHWVCTKPEVPESKKTFLVQLAWADQLAQEELRKLLRDYEQEVRLELLLIYGKIRRGGFAPDRTAREKRIWELIAENATATLTQELAWVRKLTEELCGPDEEEEQRMNIQVITTAQQPYVEVVSRSEPIQQQAEVLDLVSVCFEHGVHRLLLHPEILSEDFFRLRTGLAGEMLQKFVNYQIRAALLLPDEQLVKGKFKELLAESNRGSSFAAFTSLDEAEAWLVK